MYILLTTFLKKVSDDLIKNDKKRGYDFWGQRRLDKLLKKLFARNKMATCTIVHAYEHTLFYTSK